MRAVFRVDASVRIGSGHVMRCLTLARALARRGWEATFVCRAHSGNLSSQIIAQGIEVSLLPMRARARERGNRYADWLGGEWEEDAWSTAETFDRDGKPELLVVDHYAIDQRWERTFRQAGITVMAIDDLADRTHDCDVLLDQNYYTDLETRYSKLVPFDALRLLGPRYALLREEFLSEPGVARSRGEAVGRILVFFGGVDSSNATSKAIAALVATRRPDIEVDVVVGGGNPNRDRIEALCAQQPRFRFHCQTSRMASLMARADLAIGAGGTTTWERAFMGLPSLVMSVAENQVRAAKDVHDYGAHIYLGRSEDVDVSSLKAALEGIISSDGLLAMSRAARALMGGRSFVGADGVAELVVARTPDG